VGGVVRFPRSSTRPSDAEWHDPAENAPGSTRKAPEASLVTWIDVARLRDSDDDNDGGGAAA
jgi:hypothetical protein